jgi:Ni,Fe-hydrogenase III large subunit
VDPHAHERAQPRELALAVHGHQRHGHRRSVDDARFSSNDRHHDVRLETPEKNADRTTTVGSYGDSFDRYAIRLNEVRESMRIVRQILDRMPKGDYRIQDKRSPRRRGRASRVWRR